MLTHLTFLQLTLDAVGIFAFALSGGLVAVRARLDIFGVVVLAGAAGLGGGILRDVMLGATPPQGISNPLYLVTTVIAGLVTFWFHPGVERMRGWVDLFDAAGLAAFTATGVLKALSLGAPPLVALFMGTITAIGGGMLRDVLAGQVPQVLQGQYYALPSLAGGGVLVLANQAGSLGNSVVWATVAAIFVVRVLVMRLDVQAPVARLGQSRVPPDPHDDPSE